MEHKEGLGAALEGIDLGAPARLRRDQLPLPMADVGAPGAGQSGKSDGADSGDALQEASERSAVPAPGGLGDRKA